MIFSFSYGVHCVTYFGILMKTERQGKLQDNNNNTIRKQVPRKGSSEIKVNNSSNFFNSHVWHTIIYLIKCTLDKMPERSKIIKNISALFSLNFIKLNFVKNQRTILKRIIEYSLLCFCWCTWLILNVQSSKFT